MNRVVRIKNNTLADGTWVGKSIPAGAYIDLSDDNIQSFIADQQVFADVASGNLIVNRGGDNTGDILDPIKAWDWLTGNILPMSDIGNKLAVHSSPKPTSIDGKQVYAVWTGAGDDLSSSPSGINQGQMLNFHLFPQAGSPLVPQCVDIDVQFDPVHGSVWIHEAYLMVNNGGPGDYVEAAVIANPTPVQTVVNLVGYLEGDWIRPAFGSPSNATHGFAGTPVLVPRTYSSDGDWDYDGTNLIPNYTRTGGYRISYKEQTVHKYFNKIPCHGSFPFFSMTSDETAYLPAGYFIRVSAHNVSNTTWHANVIMEIYRERTYIP